MFNKKLVIKNTEIIQHATFANVLFRNRTWFTMSDLSRPHLALISWSATEKSCSDSLLVPRTRLLANRDNNG